MNVINKSIDRLIEMAEDEVFEGEFSKAEQLLYAALEEEPGYTKLHYTLAWMFHYHDFDEERALVHYHWAIRFDPENEKAYQGYSALLMKQKRYNDLDSLLRRAEQNEGIEKDFVYRLLAEIAEKRENFSEAITTYKKALLYSMDNDDVDELRQNIKRCRFKKLKRARIRWLQIKSQVRN